MADSSDSNDHTQPFIALTAGARVSHYLIAERIGAGGMGEVYLAHDTRLDRKVALKFLPPHLCQDEDCRKRFTREAQAAASLDHPNIAAIYEVGEFHSRPYYSMQLVEGRSLREVIEGKDLSIEHILDIMIQTCEGLQAAHDRGIIHRDIKPSNILIDTHGRVRIVDFGLAVVSGSEHLTKAGSTLGTIGYMSPEQVRGGKIDQRSDLFSLGVVLYELVTKQNPFRRANEAATLAAVTDDQPEPLARFKSALPADLQTVVEKLLEKDPTLRYQHADGLQADLGRLKRYVSSDHSTFAGKAVSTRSHRIWWITAALVIVLSAVLYLTDMWPIRHSSDDPERIMIAVLPFENLGDPADDYFADGITEEITTSLACLSGLGVISRISAMQYKDTDKSLRQIGEELNVDCVLDGTIRWDRLGNGNRVRINPQLIRVSDDMHLWADRYEAVLTDVFDVQSAIAREVAAALDVALLQSERDGLDDRPNVTPEAYEYYLRGKQYFSVARYHQVEMRTAERMHLQSIELAPDFAPAYAELGMLYAERHWDGSDTTQAILDSAKALIDIAIRLAPKAPEPYQALGWYYYHGLRDFERALDAFGTVLRRQPNNALAIASVAWVHRRQGKWEEALQGQLRVIQLAPREPWYHHELGNTYVSTRRFEKAIEVYTKVTDLQPDNEWAFFGKAWAILNLTGDPTRALPVIDEGLVYNPESPSLAFLAVYLHMINGDDERALELMTGPTAVYYKQPSPGVDYFFMKGWVYTRMQKPVLARLYLDSARVITESIAATYPDVAENQSLLGQIYALLGRKEEAIAAAQRAVELLPVSTDALDGPDYIWNLARVYCEVGEFDLALDQIDSLFSIPAKNSVKWLGIAPEFSALHDHARFQALLEKYGGERAGT